MIRTEILQRIIIGSDIDLIKKCQNFFIFNAKMIECLIDNIHLLVALRIGSIHYMNNIVRIFGFFQCTFKCLNQMMRQFPYKTYRIRQQHLLVSFQLQHPCRRVQRCKQFILL